MKAFASILAVIFLCYVGVAVTPTPKPTPIVVTPATPATPVVEVLDFYATWCGPCKANAPAIDKLEAEGVKVTRIDVDKDRERTGQYNIHSMPTYIVLVNGLESFRTHAPSELRAHLNR